MMRPRRQDSRELKKAAEELVELGSAAKFAKPGRKTQLWPERGTLRKRFSALRFVALVASSCVLPSLPRGEFACQAAEYGWLA